MILKIKPVRYFKYTSVWFFPFPCPSSPISTPLWDRHEDAGIQKKPGSYSWLPPSLPAQPMQCCQFNVQPTGLSPQGSIHHAHSASIPLQGATAVLHGGTWGIEGGCPGTRHQKTQGPGPTRVTVSVPPPGECGKGWVASPAAHQL